MTFRNAVLVFILLAVIAVGLVFFGIKTQPQAFYQGRSARAWLAALAAPPSVGQPPGYNDGAVFEAFHAMGTNAHPFLLATLEGRQTLLQRTFCRIYSKLPSGIQGRLPRPADVGSLRSAANTVLIAIYPKPSATDLLALANSEARQEVFGLAALSIAPSDTDQIPLLISTCYDTNARLRENAATCLGKIGAAASNALPALATLCAETNLGVRVTAAMALYRVTGQTNEAAPLLEGVLAQTKDERDRFNASVSLVRMKDFDPLATMTFIGLLTNKLSPWWRGAACQMLGTIGHSATNAVPALRQLVQDRDPNLRKAAQGAIARIQSEGATNVAQ